MQLAEVTMTIDSPNFRQSAREAIVRAKEELATGNLHRLRYAALELRDAMEALTYDRALAFKDEIPPEEYKTWQPRKFDGRAGRYRRFNRGIVDDLFRARGGIWEGPSSRKDAGPWRRHRVHAGQS